MDFSEQDVEIFGEELDQEEEDDERGQQQRPKQSNDDDDEQSADSSPASSSSTSSSSSGSGSASSSSDAEEDDADAAAAKEDVADAAAAEEDDADAAAAAAAAAAARHRDLFGSDDIEDEEEEDERDLFGSDNEEYVRTPALSRFRVPVLPPQQNTNNHSNSRGNFGRGRGSGLLPRPGPYPQRPNFGFGRFSHSNVRNPENFVSEMRLTKSEETLSRKAVTFQEPCEIASYSRVEDGGVYFDDRSLRLFKRLVSEDVGANLNLGFESFVEKRVYTVNKQCNRKNQYMCQSQPFPTGKNFQISMLTNLGSEGFGDLLACIRNTNIPLQNIHFVTFRNNLNKILATAYIRNEPWKMGVHKRKGVVYLDVHKLPERPQSEVDRRRCYWGYAFENLAAENSREMDGDGKGIDANVEFCSIIKTKLGAHRIIMGAEMDCCDSTDDGRKFYVELKTSRELEYRTEERYEREKLLKFWIQSFLAGVPYIVVGFRDDAGILVRTERLRTKDITQRVKMKGYWQGGVCLAFADEVLCWLYGTVRENEDYVLQFVHPYQRLELLRAQSCPDVITHHVEQL